MIRRAALAALTVLSASACKEDSNTVTIPAIALIVITPRDPVTTVGGTIQLSAKAYGFHAQNGFLWRTSDPAIAQVSGSGLVFGIAKGNTVLVAKAAFDTTLMAPINVIIE